MKLKYLMFIFLGTFIGMGLFADAAKIKTITFDANTTEDWNQRLEDNEVFFKRPAAIKVEANKYLYYLSTSPVTIFKVDLKTGKLLKTIASGGQGPHELQSPQAMTVKNGKVFVFDFSYNGIKIYSTEGNPITEFKIKQTPMAMGSYLDRNTMDVDSKNEIHIRVIDPKNGTLVSVYNEKGEKLRDMIPFSADIEKDQRDYMYKTNIALTISDDDHLFVLYKLKNLLVKYDTNGKEIWKRDLNQDLTPEEGYESNFKIQNKKKERIVSFRLSFLGLVSLYNNHIFVSAGSCGLIYDSMGKPFLKIKRENLLSFGVVFGWAENLLITPFYSYRLPAGVTIR